MYSFQKVETVAFEKVRRLPYETSNSVNVLKCVGIQFLSPLFVLVFARLPKNVWKSSANFGWSSEIYGRVLVIARGQGREVFQNVRAIFVDIREGSGDLWKALGKHPITFGCLRNVSGEPLPPRFTLVRQECLRTDFGYLRSNLNSGVSN